MAGILDAAGTDVDAGGPLTLEMLEDAIEAIRAQPVYPRPAGPCPCGTTAVSKSTHDRLAAEGGIAVCMNCACPFRIVVS